MFMNVDNVELLVKKDGYDEIARVLPKCLHKIKGKYALKCMMTKKTPTETEKQR